MCLIIREEEVFVNMQYFYFCKKKWLLHERPYRLAAFATSPALAGGADMP